MTARPLAWVRARALAAFVAVMAATAFVAPAQAEYSRAQLEAFVTAAITVETLAEQWIPRIKDAESEEAAAVLRSQAKDQVQDAINGIDGISVDQYKAINEAARQDKKLAERIVEIYRGKTVE